MLCCGSVRRKTSRLLREASEFNVALEDVTTDQKLNLYNTYWAVILPLAALQIPFAVLLTRNFISGLPNELFEAVRVDGAGPVRTFRHLIVPLTRPIAAAVIIFTLIAAWNDYLMPLVFEQATNMQTYVAWKAHRQQWRCERLRRS